MKKNDQQSDQKAGIATNQLDSSWKQCQAFQNSGLEFYWNWNDQPKRPDGVSDSDWNAFLTNLKTANAQRFLPMMLGYRYER